ncbi:MAG: MMPL family transporter [Alcanivoracaceae bacterium]|nr:MMPL family transporter [Alcanivoracaceae bacterium]
MPFPVWLGDTIARRYRLVTVLMLAVCLGLAAGAARLSFTADFRVYFSDDNPQLIAFEQLEEDFNKRDTLTILVQPVEGSVFDEDMLTLVRQLTDMAWTLPYSRRVDSLANHQQLTSDADSLYARDLLGDERDLSSPQTREAIRRYASEEPAVAGFLAAPDGSVAAINIALLLPDGDTSATREVLDATREKLAAFENDWNDRVQFHLYGTAVINLALEDAVARDLSLLVPLSTVLIYALVFFLLRSTTGLVLVITTISLSVATVFGVFGWAGQMLTPATGMIPNMVMIIAVADCIHLLVTYYHEMGQGKDRQAAMRESLRINFAPMLVTSVTTAIGLLCLNFSEAPPYRALGNMGALGAVLAFIITVTLIPALLCWLPAGKAVGAGKGSAALFGPMGRLGERIIRHRRGVMFASLALVALCAFGIPENRLMERWHHYYDDSFPVKQALNVQDAHLNGVNFIQYRVGTGETSGINRPEVVAQLAALHDWLEQQPEVVYVEGLLPHLRKVHRLLEAGAESATDLPESRERAAQNLLLYEMSLPMGLGLEEYLDSDRSSTRLSVFFHKTDSRTLMAFDQRARDWAAENTPALAVSEGTGLDMVFAHISDRNMVSLLKGTALALVLISVLMVFVLRSLRLGLISLVPNLVPVIAAYGLWGHFVGYVDLGLSVVACMSLGLVVDDTVHFLSKYVRARRELGQSPQDAVQYAFGTVGAAMLVTTLVLAAGFALLILSPFSPTWGMGGLLSLTIVLALVFDFLLLPPLLLVTDSKKG